MWVSDDDRELLAQSMGIPLGWAKRVLRAVGNYGEVYEHNVGRTVRSRSNVVSTGFGPTADSTMPRRSTE
jgi:hypothetical protein